MSGGISAIKGFDYQATVILNRLFDHFDRYGATAQARPEGIDDLDLIWVEGDTEHRRYEQIKKPQEDNDGKLKPTPWTLAAAIEKLLPNTVAHLSGNSDTQIWIVGDEVSDELSSLIAAGESAPTGAAKGYWSAVHGLARNEAIRDAGLDQSLRQKLRRWRLPHDLPVDPPTALSRMTTEFGDLAEKSGASDVAARYRQRVVELHGCLPGVLARTQISPAYGSEQEVARRVYERLEQRYALQRVVIEDTLFRNLRGFINDISKQPGRKFDQEELEFVLRGIWPRMIPLRDAPSVCAEHVARPDLVERFTTHWSGKAIEAVGISGSGKTTLAAEVAQQSRIADPDRRVYYAEVRPDVALRDVLAGVGFNLRAIGIREPFAVSVESGPADEEVLVRLARVYSAIPQEILLLVDLVEGTCSTAFARDLATFIRRLSSSAYRIAVLGQESGLRELTPLERDEHGVSRLDIRGFRFKEFVRLVSHHHTDPDQAALWDIFQRVTAGRAAGLFAQLARSLARASLSEMQDLAARPAEDILPLAEQRRFGLVSSGARSAAEKLVCFALPFQRKDAEEIFPDDNVGAAVGELLTQGLLCPLSEGLFEMHETVRAGLEGKIALNVRRATHRALAAWYGAQGTVTAQILHLEKAGGADEAHQLARETLLRAERWAALAAYVTSHKLVSAGEVIRTIADAKPVEDQYLLSSLLRGLGEPAPVDELLQVLRGQPERFLVDYQWALAVVEAILEFDPARLHDLILLALEAAGDPSRRGTALNYLLIAARRRNGVIGSRTVEFFSSQPPEIKRPLLRFLVLSRRRDTLRPAFQFLASDPEATEGQRRPPRWRDLALLIGNRDDAVEFLAALPAVKPAAMLIAKSALLEPLSGLIWAQREMLRAQCVGVVQDGAMEEQVLVNAIRVLVFLAEPSICALCDPLMARKDAAGAFAKLVPALVPAFCDRSRFEARLLDCTVELQDRVTALFCARVGRRRPGRPLPAAKGRRKRRAEGPSMGLLVSNAQRPDPIRRGNPATRRLHGVPGGQWRPPHRLRAHEAGRITSRGGDRGSCQGLGPRKSSGPAVCRGGAQPAAIPHGLSEVGRSLCQRGRPNAGCGAGHGNRRFGTPVGCGPSGPSRLAGNLALAVHSGNAVARLCHSRSAHNHSR